LAYVSAPSLYQMVVEQCVHKTNRAHRAANGPNLSINALREGDGADGAEVIGKTREMKANSPNSAPKTQKHTVFGAKFWYFGA
ncbi:MAG: hypothetical protein Q4D56_14230, partial [Bacteroides sp.]|nr:hypothetical protein [Bacteroides sp.]